MKAIKFNESEYYSIELPKGMYEVDGKVIEVSTFSGEKVQVKNINNIIPITRKDVIHFYVNGDTQLSVEEYNTQLQKLLSHSIQDEDGYRSWDSLEDEFAYRKFISSHSPIYRNIETRGDTLSIEIVESAINSGNPYISSDYINGGKDPLLFIYNRYSAVNDIVSNKFKELGMTFSGKCSYEETNNKKIWGNSTHSGVRFVVAFNKYPLQDKWEIKYNPRGTLSQLLVLYNKDKEELENILQTNYNIHFGKFEEKELTIRDILSKLNNCKNRLSSVEYKSKSYDDYRQALSHLNQAISQIQDGFKESIK